MDLITEVSLTVELDCTYFAFFVPNDMTFDIELTSDVLDGEFLMPLKYELDTEDVSWSTHCGFAIEMTLLE